jgi:hypothetical protein
MYSIFNYRKCFGNTLLIKKDYSIKTKMNLFTKLMFCGSMEKLFNLLIAILLLCVLLLKLLLLLFNLMSSFCIKSKNLPLLPAIMEFLVFLGVYLTKILNKNSNNSNNSNNNSIISNNSNISNNSSSSYKI